MRMVDHAAGFAYRSTKGSIVIDPEDLAEDESPKRRSDRCHQCRFPWSLHGKRYDAEEHAFIRVCSEYPARPVRSIQDCIVP
jgi:hypothetical protein